MSALSRMIVVVLLFSGLTLSSGRADEPVPDWSGFVNHSKVSGVVAKSTTDHIVLQIPKLERKKTYSRNRSSRRPSYKVATQNITVPYATQGLVRWKKIPQKSDGKGGTIFPTTKEQEQYLKPIGAPGYAADKSELRPGHVVELQIVRPRNITQTQATTRDLSIKFAVIQGETNPPKATTVKKR